MIRVKQYGKLNQEFIVRDQKKIEFWKWFIDKMKGNATLVRLSYEEIKK